LEVLQVGEIQNIMVSVLVVGIVVFALVGSFSDIATNYDANTTETTDNLVSTFNQSGAQIGGWATGNATEFLQQNEYSDNLILEMTSGTFALVNSFVFLPQILYNITVAFVVALGIAPGLANLIIGTFASIFFVIVVFAAARGILKVDL
jgi:hypothetical protein